MKASIVKIRELLAKNEIGDALREMGLVFKDNANLDELIQQSGRFEDIRKQIRLGVVSFEDHTMTINQIRISLLELLREIETTTSDSIGSSADSAETIISDSKNILQGDFHIGRDLIVRDNSREINSIQILPPKLESEYLKRRIIKGEEQTRYYDYSLQEKNNVNLFNVLEEHRYIVLLGDAGLGKSTELINFSHELCDRRNTITVYKKLNNYVDNTAYLDDIPKIPNQEENKVYLIIDGLDEVDIELAKRGIERFKNTYKKAKILVSCRQNIYANTLDGFIKYSLVGLESEVINNYLEQKLGSFKREFLNFWNRSNPWDHNRLLDNPFFLVRICEYVNQNNNKIPNSIADIFEYLINQFLDLRLKKISNFGKGSKKKLRNKCQSSLERLAFIMEFRGVNIISDVELRSIISNEAEIEILLGKSSLIERQGSNWRFTHNNFQEY